MKKILVLTMAIICILANQGTSEKVFANANNVNRPLEEIYPEIGYKTVEEAVKEFEHHFKRDLKLPLRLPSLSFTHHFGRFTDAEGTINDHLELEFISDIEPQNHYTLFVRPIEHKIPIKDKRIVKRYKLKNGQEAKFIHVSVSIQALVFERDHWQYMLCIPKSVLKKATPEVLVQIANSIDYPSEKKNPLE
ncbi:hypothetical protein JCM9140_3953 [Halalkalibacter wakoensis JCM 9140]|uniref:Uncharacterized protein n=1 Tax=Halalkalibacter wakoensis JCM 9140 TaxID=1236970 RepID=W4Q8R1_9BACI|nr:hypothetical protein [Halalkalibacter wakoensis]GAE27794.1 hypothetical protein JCM9140_3953 [Halalkalibacter wakoensis JCM 9140]